MEHPLLGFVRAVDDGKGGSTDCTDLPTVATSSRGSQRGMPAARQRPFVAVLKAFRLWVRRRTEARELLAMSERELSDIGMTRYDAVSAARGPLWKSNAVQAEQSWRPSVETAVTPPLELSEVRRIRRPSSHVELADMLHRGRRARSDALHCALSWLWRHWLSGIRLVPKATVVRRALRSTELRPLEPGPQGRSTRSERALDESHVMGRERSAGR